MKISELYEEINPTPKLDFAWINNRTEEQREKWSIESMMRKNNKRMEQMFLRGMYDGCISDFYGYAVHIIERENDPHGALLLRTCLEKWPEHATFKSYELIGNCYRDGFGVQKNERIAWKYYEKAFEIAKKCFNSTKSNLNDMDAQHINSEAADFLAVWYKEKESNEAMQKYFLGYINVESSRRYVNSLDKPYNYVCDLIEHYSSIGDIERANYYKKVFDERSIEKDTLYELAIAYEYEFYCMGFSEDNYDEAEITEIALNTPNDEKAFAWLYLKLFKEQNENLKGVWYFFYFLNVIKVIEEKKFPWITDYDMKIAIDYMEKLAESGDVEAAEMLALYYSDYAGIEPNKDLYQHYSEIVKTYGIDVDRIIKLLYFFDDPTSDIPLLEEYAKDDAEAQYILAEYYEKKNNLAEAKVLFEKAAAARFPEAVCKLGKLCFDEGKYEKAKQYFKDVIENFKDNPDALRDSYIYYGIILSNESSNKTYDSLEMLNKATAIDNKVAAEMMNSVAEKYKTSSLKREVVDEIRRTREVMLGEFEKTNSKIDSIALSINDIVSKVSEMKEHLGNRCTDDELCNRITETLIKDLEKQDDAMTYQDELKAFFGDIWNKLDSYSRNALVSAKTLMEMSKHAGYGIDYSGVCITASSALESEMRRVFFDGFDKYIKEKDVALPDTVYGDYGKKKIFTLGTIPFVLGLKKGRDSSNESYAYAKELIGDYLDTIMTSTYKGRLVPDECRENCQHCPYCTSCIAGRTEFIRTNYRNDAAHAGKTITRDSAEKCCEAIIGRIDAENRIGEIVGVIKELYLYMK